MENNDSGYGCLYKIMFVIGLFGVLGMLFILATEGFVM